MKSGGHVIISRQEFFVFKMAAFGEGVASQFLSLFKEKQHVFVEQMKILQENTKMMHRYSLNLDNMM